MRSRQVICIDSSDNLTPAGIRDFWKEALGEHFTVKDSLFLKEDETVFFGSDHTTVTLHHEDSTTYLLTIESLDSRIVRGLTGYVEEVMEEWTTDRCHIIFA